MAEPILLHALCQGLPNFIVYSPQKLFDTLQVPYTAGQHPRSGFDLMKALSKYGFGEAQPDAVGKAVMLMRKSMSLWRSPFGSANYLQVIFGQCLMKS